MELINLDSFINESKPLQLNNPLIVTIGMFDGVHLAHRALIKKMIDEAKRKNLKSGVITFNYHPDFVLEKRENKGYLTNIDEKIRMLKSLEIDYLFVITFTKEFSLISHEDFESLLTKLNVKAVIAGRDAKYGYKGLGNIETLKKKFEVIEFSDYYIDGELIHSKNIRISLEKGEIEKANKLLGYNFYVRGIVAKGRQIGRTYNVKTANIELNNEYDYLISGVYGVKVIIDDKEYIGICNIGNNPSFNYTFARRLEVNIFDFNEDIYGKEIIVEMITFIRKEKKFNSKEELKIQIEKDTKYYLDYLEEKR